ncbi:transglutaminase family protein [Phenylobacterium sp.]|uniref:transglutaminase family protein n=1 Tax=Phenylobacterium sp. TaxID=1871053 RepID=UPI0025FC1A9C|nr:transglutaminase family protein [Phenylobacterium sp.]
MLLEIRHVTQYRYAAPVRESVMEVWMQPQKSASQRLVSFDLELDPPAQLFSFADTFGNPVYHFDVPQPHERLTITANAAVETQPPPRLPEELDMGEWDRLRSAYLRGDNFDYLHPHGFARETAALRQYALDRDIEALRQSDPLTALRALSALISSSFGYESGVTRADSPIDDVLRTGKGVSQDFAHVMITLCRSWGIPARYVSGYLFTDRRKGDRSESDATHAWVEVFLPSLRWVGFDPSNNCEATERHVACAIGRDYSDVPPSRGVYKGDADHQLAVGVSVRKARAAISEPEFLRTTRQSGRPGASRGAAMAHQPRLHQMQQQQSE